MADTASQTQEQFIMNILSTHRRRKPRQHGRDIARHTHGVCRWTIRFGRTYANRQNAIKALETACKKIGTTTGQIRFVIAVSESGRFAPVVFGVSALNNQLLFCGITWVT